MANQATITTNIDDGGTISSNVVSGATITAAVTTGGVGATGATGGTGATGPQGPQGPAGTFEDYFNVKNYGAVGDGVADDASAIDHAIGDAAINGGVVFFPTGTYKITHALTVKTGISLLGTGSEAVIINQTDATDGAIIGTDVASVRIEGMLFDGGTSSGNGIDLGWSAAGNLPFLHFTDVWVRNFGGSGISLETPIVSIFERVVSQDNGAHGFDLYHAGTSCTFISCWARGNAEAGYHFFESVYMNLSGCASDNNGINYLVESAQSIGFYACGSEGALMNNATYNGYGFKIANSSIINIDSCWITDNRNVAIWITDGSQEVKINAADNSPHVGAVNFIKTDVSTNSTIYELHNTTANSLSAGTANIMNDGALGIQVKSFKVKDASGTLSLTAATDASEYNLSADTTGVLSLFGSGGQTLNMNLLDGYLQLSPLTATTVPYLDSNKRLTSSAVTPTELGYVHGVTGAIQTQIDAKALDSNTVHKTGTESIGGAKTFTTNPSVLGAFANFSAVNTDGSQFSGAGFSMYSTTATLAGAAGVQFYAGIADVGATDTYLNIQSISKTGAYVGDIMSIGLTTKAALFQGSVGAASFTAGGVAVPTISSVSTLTNKTLTSPTLTTPVLGVATATSINKITLTQPATGSTLTLVDGSSLITAGAFALTLTSTATTGITFPTGSSTMTGVTNTQTLTNKTITGLTLTAGTTAVAPMKFSGVGALLTAATANTIEWDGTDFYYTDSVPTRRKIVNTNSTQTLTSKTLSGNTAATLISGSGTLTLNTTGTITLPNATDTLVGKATTDTLTNKTLTTPSIDTINSAAASHLVLNAGTSKLVKLTTLRQDDTTNTYKVGTSVMLTGWGQIVPGVSAQATETITFGVTFLQRPIVVATWGGDAPTGATYGGGGNNVKGLATCKAEVITTGGFDVRIRTTDASSWGATDIVFYQWIAIGEL